MLSKLIAIGGAVEEETFEVQVKIPIQETDSIIQALSASNNRNHPLSALP